MYCMYLLQISYRLTIKPLINKTQRLPSGWVAIFKKLSTAAENTVTVVIFFM